MTPKLALITGSTSGIGLGIAKKLAQEGHQIILNGLNTPSIQNVIDDVQALTPHPVFYDATDLTNPTAIETMVQTITDTMGSIDILINNAGLQFVSPLPTFPTEKWDTIIALNLSAVFHTMRLIIPSMTAKKWGRIVNMASAHALVASPFKAAYVAAKHGVAGLTKVAALEVAKENITVNAICPGYVHTALVEGQIENTALSRGISREAVIQDVMLGNQATKKFVTIEEVANLVAFLCQETTSSITGSLLSIDGGWTAH